MYIIYVYIHIVAMATIARHVIANEYPSVDESVKTVTSDSHEGTPHSDETRARLEESGREDSPSSTSSGHEPCDSTVVCYSQDVIRVHIHVCTALLKDVYAQAMSV